MSGRTRLTSFTTAGLSICFGAGLLLLPVETLAVFGACGLVTMCLLQPAIIFQLMLVGRSSLDLFTDVAIYIGALKLNLPAVASLVLDLSGLAFIGVRAMTGRRIRLTPVGLTFLCWLAVLPYWIVEAYINYGDPGLAALREWVRLSSLLVIFLVTLNSAREWGVTRMSRWLLVSLVAPLMGMVCELVFGVGLFRNASGRMFSTIAHPNALAIFLVLFIGLTLRELHLSERMTGWRVLLALEIMGLVMTFSLGGLVMLIALLVILVCLGPPGRLRVHAIVALAMGLSVFALSDYGRLRIEDLRGAPGIGEVISLGNITNSMTWRVYHWKMLLSEWLKHPILGYGLDTTADFVSPWRAAPHNDYLRYLVETGIVGLVFFACLQLVIGIMLAAEVKERRRRGDRASLAVIAFAVYGAWVIGSLADNFITSTAFQYAFWALLGIVMSESGHAAGEEAQVRERAGVPIIPELGLDRR